MLLYILWGLKSLSTRSFFTNSSYTWSLIIYQSLFFSPQYFLHYKMEFLTMGIYKRPIKQFNWFLCFSYSILISFYFSYGNPFLQVKKINFSPQLNIIINTLYTIKSIFQYRTHYMFLMRKGIFKLKKKIFLNNLNPGG